MKGIYLHGKGIRERLDRGVINPQWHALFPNAKLVNGEMTKSDHRPLIVDTGGYDVQMGNSQCRVKRFEVRWLKEETIEEMVNAAWVRAATKGEISNLKQKTS